MSSSLKRAVRELFVEAKKTTSALKKILNPPNDDSFSGNRIFPAKDNKKEEKFGIRIDRGQSVKGQPNLVTINLQVNSNANKKSLQDLVKKYGSHKKYVTMEVDTTQQVTTENLDKLQESIESKIDELGDL